MARVLVLLLCLAAACTPGTGRGPSPPASHGLRDLIAALRSDDPHPAYALLAADIRKQTPYDEFAALWKQTAAERELEARALEEGLKGNPELDERARVEYRDGKTVHLERERGGWRLEAALLSPFHATRPHDAVRAFAEALAGRDYEAVLRVLTSRRREALRSQVDDFVSGLVRHLDAEVTLLGDDGAELSFQEGDKRYRIVLVREGDEWRVDDVHIRAVPPDDKPKPKKLELR